MDTNDFVSNYIEIIKWKSPKDIKVEFLLRITSNCNLSCKYCFSQQRFGSPDTKDILIRLKQIMKNENIGHQDPVLINITGGEPLVRRDFFVLLESLKGVLKKYSLNIQTNATLIDDNIARRLKALNITSAFVGIAALSEKDYSFITQRRGYYNRALSGIESLLNAGINVCINFVLSKVSEERFLDIPLFVYDRFKGLPSVNLSSLSPGTPFEFLRLYGIDYRRCGSIFEKVYFELKKKGIQYGAFGGDCSPPICAFKKREIIKSYSFGSSPLPIVYVKDFNNISDGYRYKLASCKKCKYNNPCTGISSVYARVFKKANFSY